jgi:adenylylsulfate kinase
MKSSNTLWHAATVTRDRREKMNGHRGVVVWFTGLSGAGKSTLAHAVEEYLHQAKCRTIVLDGDNIRHGLCGDLGFSDEDRRENIRRVGEVARLMVDGGMIVLAAFISPFHADRERARRLLDKRDFIEIYCRCPVEICERRDVKGLYKRARQGEIRNFTGISSPYEIPETPDLIVDTGRDDLDVSLQQVLEFLVVRGVITGCPATFAIS